MTSLSRIVFGCLTLGVAVAAPAQDTDPASAGAYPPPPARSGSILRQHPWHEDFMPSRSYGFRNPGGVGRMAEYYPPGDHFQNERDGAPHVTARIGLGGVPDRSEQLQSQAVGTQRYNALQMHIDRYGRPQWGFGYGFGFGYPY